MGSKVGVHICSGCGIGEAVDVARLQAVAEGEFGAHVTTHPRLCGPAGLSNIRRDLTEEGRDRLVIAACSPRVNVELFSLDSAIVERVNLREQVAWCHPPADEDTQALAEDQLRMGIVKVQKTEPLAPLESTVERTVMVVGGGVTGLTAALGVARAGGNAILVEREPRLGGWLLSFDRVSPTRAPYREPETPNIADLVSAVLAEARIAPMTSTTIEEVSGQPGDFEVVANCSGNTIHFRAGSIVLATGWEPYDATKLQHLGFGCLPDVISSVMLEEQVRHGKLVRPSDGLPPRSVLFIQCAGSRDENHLPYCSAFCCQVSLKQALYVRRLQPAANVYILHRDIRTPAQYEEFYKRVQEEDQVFFLRGEVSRVSAGPDGNLVVEAHDTQLGPAINLEADLVVLAVGMVPVGIDALKLRYRQGPDVPTAHHGFADSNFVCWPYETQRTGIFSAGCVREPMIVADCIQDAEGAAMRAIQAITLLEQGAALHPRVGDLSYPSFFLQRCTQCKRCTEECPFGAINEDAKGTPEINPNRCRRCGVCMGACPERLISFKNYSIDQISSMIKAIEVPEDEDKQRILVLACENDAYPALDMAGALRMQYDSSFRVIPLRCLGSTNVVFIADAMSRGFDGVLLLGCRYGDDYQCHFVKGSELANRRMENVKETLGRLRLEPERVKLEQLTIAEYDKLPNMLNDFAAELRELGPNPYKGF
jgi:quinone-modifying oxidoreductase subunit QmoB